MDSAPGLYLSPDQIYVALATLAGAGVFAVMVALIIVGFVVRQFVLNQMAHLEIHIRGLLSGYIPKDDLTARLSRIHQRLDPLAERVAALEKVQELRGPPVEQ